MRRRSLICKSAWHPNQMVFLTGSFSMDRDRVEEGQCIAWLDTGRVLVQIAVYGVPGSDDLGEKVWKVFADGCDIAILENHSVCIGAPDMFAAFQRFETLNYTAELEILAGKISTAPGSRGPPHGGEHLSHQAGRLHPPYHHRGGAVGPTGYDHADPPVLPHGAVHRHPRDLFRGSLRRQLPDHALRDGPAYLEEDLVRVKTGMKEVGKIPSRAVQLHESIYRDHPDVRAVLQAYPPYAMAFVVTEPAFDPRTIPESYILLRDIKKLPFERLYADLAAASREFGAATPAVMVESDCVIVTGNSLLQVFDCLEVLESTAHSIINSRSLGEIVHITGREIDDLKAVFHLEV